MNLAGAGSWAGTNHLRYGVPHHPDSDETGVIFRIDRLVSRTTRAGDSLNEARSFYGGQFIFLAHQ